MKAAFMMDVNTFNGSLRQAVQYWLSWIAYKFIMVSVSVPVQINFNLPLRMCAYMCL